MMCVVCMWYDVSFVVVVVVCLVWCVCGVCDVSFFCGVYVM